MDREILKLLNDHQPKHSGFQIEQFIIGSQGDQWARYKQALREIDDRYHSLIEKRAALALMDLKKYWPFGRAAKIKAKIRQRRREATVIDIAETERELKQFVAIAAKLKDRIGKLDPEKRQRLEADSWLQKARRMTGIDLMVNGGQLSRATLEMVLALPRPERETLLSEVTTCPDPARLLKL